MYSAQIQMLLLYLIQSLTTTVYLIKVDSCGFHYP